VLKRRKGQFVMQQMNSQEDKGQNAYGQYESVPLNDHYNEPYSVGQKLASDDEEPVYRVKRESSRGSSSDAGRMLTARMIVAVVSLCVLVPIFALLVFALVIGHISGGGTIALGWGVVGIIIAIIYINAYFNKMSNSISKQENDKQAK